MDDDQTCPESVLLILMERAFRGPEYAGTQIRDWQPHMKRVLQCVRENDPVVAKLRTEIERLNAELERERIRLAACGVVALADTPKSAASARQMREEYRSASCDDVARRVDDCMRLRTEIERLTTVLADRERYWKHVIRNYESTASSLRQVVEAQHQQITVMMPSCGKE